MHDKNNKTVRFIGFGIEVNGNTSRWNFEYEKCYDEKNRLIKKVDKSINPN